MPQVGALLPSNSSPFVRPLPGVQNLEKCNPTRASFIRKKKHFCLLQPYLVWKFLSHWSRKTNPKFRGTLKSLPKIVSKKIHKEESVHSAKTAKCVSSCVASQVHQVPDNLPSFPSKAEFSQNERLSKPRCPLDRSWNWALANRSLPAQQTRHQDKNCVQIHCRPREWTEAQLQRAKTTTFSTERRSFQSINSIACLSAACTRKMATLQ